MYESTDMAEPLLQSRDRVGNGTEILTYYAGFCTATNSDKLSEASRGAGRSREGIKVSVYSLHDRTMPY
jgi:threonine synthase